MKTICVCTTVHNTWDGRIYEKEITTLLKKFQVIYLAQESAIPGSLPKNLTFIPLKKSKNRLFRMFRLLSVFKILWSLRNRVDAYHVHDPELAPILAALRIFTRKFCVFDVHENYVGAIRDRWWIPAPLRKLAAICYKAIEKICLPYFNFLVLVSEEIKQLYPDHRVIILRNLPSQSHYKTVAPIEQKKPYILLAGGLTKVRGVIETVQAFIRADLPGDFYLVLLGWYESKSLEQSVNDMLSISSKKDRFQHQPFVPYHESVKFIQDSSIGVISYLDFMNHRFGIPTKTYEFMASRTPIIYNDLPNYRHALSAHDIGECTNCSNTEEYAKAMETLAHNPKRRMVMGHRGRELFLQQFNWEIQESLLLSLYKS